MPIVKTVRLSVVLAAGWLVGGTAAAEVVVIVSAKSPVTTLRADQVSDIFLGKAGTYPGTGIAAVPLDQPEDSATRQEFYAKAAGKSPSLLKLHWSKLIFTGKGQPPKEVANSDTLKKLVAENPKFIGYVNKHPSDPALKVVLVLE